MNGVVCNWLNSAAHEMHAYAESAANRATVAELESHPLSSDPWVQDELPALKAQIPGIDTIDASQTRIEAFVSFVKSKSIDTIGAAADGPLAFARDLICGEPAKEESTADALRDLQGRMNFTQTARRYGGSGIRMESSWRSGYQNLTPFRTGAADAKPPVTNLSPPPDDNDSSSP